MTFHVRGGFCDRRCIRTVAVLLPMSLVITFLYFLHLSDQFLPGYIRTSTEQADHTAGGYRGIDSSTNATQDLHALQSLQGPIAKDAKSVNKSAWGAVLSRYCSEDKTIILALVDSAFYDMTMNFYETSLARFGIKNYLFIASDRTACEMLLKQNINCYIYMGDASAEKATVWGSKDFKRKMNIRTYMILDALELGYHVLHTDIDIVFLKNPLEDIQCGTNCDMAVLWDDSAYNAGFLLTRATKPSIEVYKKSKQTALSTSQDDQAALNGAIRHVRSKKIKINIVKLDVKKYVCGFYYWEKAKRYFADMGPGFCKECVVIHNNWIVTREAKTYRFKETHLWMYDGNKYYSDPTRKYIQFGNAATFKTAGDVKKSEQKALESALAIAIILNRTLILPKLHADASSPSFRPLNSFFKVSKFDAQFGTIYRESSFLSHPKVPKSIRDSVSKSYLIETNTSKELFGDLSESADMIKMQPKDKTQGASSDEIKKWFSNETASVLKFHSLYGAFGSFSSEPEQAGFTAKCKAGFVTGGYRQY